MLQLGVEPLQDAEAKLALALHGDDARVRQLVCGIGLELDALLEVHEVELDLVGTVRQGDLGNERVEQSGFARSGLARDEGMLGRAVAEREELALQRARAAKGDRDAAA